MALAMAGKKSLKRKQERVVMWTAEPRADIFLHPRLLFTMEFPLKSTVFSLGLSFPINI